MPRFEQEKEYLKEVCAHVRWKQAHGVIERELGDHMEDQYEALCREGVEEREAAEKAVAEMGDPALVGAKLDMAYQPKLEWSAFVPFILLAAAGFILRSMISASFGVELGDSLWDVPLLVLLFTLVYRFNIARLPRYAWWGYGLYCGAVCLLPQIFMGSGWPLVNGAYAYSAYVPLLLPALYALLIYRMRGAGLRGLFLLGACFVLPGFFTAQNNLGVLAMITLSCLGLLTYAVLCGWFRCKKWLALIAVYVPAVFGAFLFLYTAPYRLARFFTALAPELDPLGGGWFGANIRELMAKSRFFGPLDTASLSTAGQGFLEQSLTLGTTLCRDCFLTALSLKYGYFVFILITALLTFFLARAFLLCKKQPSMLGRLVSMAAVFTLAVQSISYILFNLGITLSVLPLPLVAPGRASLYCNVLLCGLLFSVLRSGTLMRDGPLQPWPKYRLKLEKTQPGA